MKTVLSTIGVFLVILVFGIWTLNMLHIETSQFITYLDNLEQAIKIKNWKNAQAILEKILAKWDHSHKKWGAILDHLEIDSINREISELEACIKTQNDKDAFIKINTLRVLYRHLPEKESFRLENIF